MINTLSSGDCTDNEIDNLFLGVLTTSDSKPLLTDILVEGRKVQFKVDTGVNVTVLPENMIGMWGRQLEPSEKTLRGPSEIPGRLFLHTLGK